MHSLRVDCHLINHLEQCESCTWATNKAVQARTCLPASEIGTSFLPVYPWTPLALLSVCMQPLCLLLWLSSSRKAHLAAAGKSRPDQRNEEGLLPGCWLTCWRAADAVLLLHIRPSSPAGWKLISWQPDENGRTAWGERRGRKPRQAYGLPKCFGAEVA